MVGSGDKKWECNICSKQYIRKDAFDNLRPIGLHISFVIKRYLEGGK